MKNHIQNYYWLARKCVHVSVPIIQSQLLQPADRPVASPSGFEKVIGTEIHTHFMVSLRLCWMWKKCWSSKSKWRNWYSKSDFWVLLGIIANGCFLKKTICPWPFWKCLKLWFRIYFVSTLSKSGPVLVLYISDLLLKQHQL